MSEDVLDLPTLNRATLARQLLLERGEMPALAAVEHLVGLQAQMPLNPYTALWSRLDRFAPEELAGLLVERQAVRTAVMRATIHLVSADDCLLLRPLMQPVLDWELTAHPEFWPKLIGVPLDEVARVARELFAERPRTNAQLRAALAERFPPHDAGALAYACRCRLPLVQVPPRGVWGKTRQVTSTTAEAWLGRPLASEPSLEDVLLRYLAAFGPATVADMSTWSRLTGLRETVERLRPRLLTFRDERGRELFDLPDAPRPDGNTPAPPRYLPEYDNVLLSHADRSRFVSPERRARLAAVGGIGWGSVLHDGVPVAVWRLEPDRKEKSTALAVRLVERLPKRSVASLAAEGRRLLRFLTEDAAQSEVRLVEAY